MPYLQEHARFLASQSSTGMDFAPHQYDARHNRQLPCQNCKMMCNRQNKLCPASGLQRNFSNTKGIHWLSPVMTSLVDSCWVAPARIPSPVVGAALQYCHETATVALQSGRCGVAPNLNPPNSELFEDGMRLRDLLLEKKHMLGLTLLFPSGSVCLWFSVCPGPKSCRQVQTTFK